MMKIHYVLKGSNGETHTRIKKNCYNNKRTHFATYSFSIGFTNTFCKMCTAPKREPPDVVHLAQQ